MPKRHVSTSLVFKVKESCWIHYPIVKLSLIENGKIICKD